MRLSPVLHALCAALVTLAFAPSSSAHPLVDDGLGRLREADFRAAMTAFDRAEAASDLTLQDLLMLLEGRAMAALATADDRGVQEALARLAALEPAHRFGPEAPPEIRAQFERTLASMRRRLGLEVRATRRSGGLLLEAVVVGDPGGLVRSVRLSARPVGGTWRDWNERSARLSVRPDQPVEAHAIARGPGGAIVAEAGTRQRPVPLAAAPRGPVGAGQAQGDDDDDRGGGAATWAWVGAGAAVVAAAAVLTAVALSSSGPSDLTQPGSPETP